MRGEIGELIDLEFLCALQEPAEVVPEERRVSDIHGADVSHLVERHEGDDVLIHELLLFVALPQAHEDLFAFVHGLRCVAGIGGGF